MDTSHGDMSKYLDKAAGQGEVPAMADDPSDDYLFVGAFTPGEIKRVTNHLERLAIDYQVEFDDSEIRELSPVSASHGLFGASATVKLYIDPQKLMEFEAVIETLYPP